jgi:endonuclease/exonuclease/phosphatase family metal-dependent hydrolase
MSRLPTALLVVIACAACPIGRPGGNEGEGEGEGEGDAGPDYPLPATDATDKLGTPGGLDVGAWNLKNFPCGNESFSTTCRANPEDTPRLVADLIASMDLDLVAVEEVADEAAFQELVDRLPEHDGVLSTDTYSDGTYQKIGFIYRSSVLEAGDPSLLFRSNDAFPRPALQVPFTWTGEGASFTFLAIGVHLKAGEANDDFARRGEAVQAMDAYARNLVDGAGEDNIVFLGDFNENLRDSDGAANFQPFRDTSRYTIRTQPNVDAHETSFLPDPGVILDHVVTTKGFDAASCSPALIPRLDSDVTSYRSRISDHLPVTFACSAP